MKATAETFQNTLAHFNGSDQIYRYALGGSLYTEGARYFMENDMHWLINDMLICVKFVNILRSQEFLNIRFTKNDNGSAQVVYDDGNDMILHTQDYTKVDALVDKAQFYFENNTLHLPSER